LAQPAHPAGGCVGVVAELLRHPAADAKTSAQEAVSESRDQLRQRIDQAKVEVDQKTT
jgi:NAD(P)H-nitrite reductase large subunit